MDGKGRRAEGEISPSLVEELRDKLVGLLLRWLVVKRDAYRTRAALKIQLVEISRAHALGDNYLKLVSM